MARVWYVLALLMLNPCVFADEKCTEERKHNRVSEIIKKLCGLGELQPRHCLTEVESMKVKQPETPSERNWPWVMKAIFEFTYQLFQKNKAPAEWKHRETLGHLLGQQSECFPNATTADAAAAKEVGTWSNFGSRLDQFLEQKNFSACAWEGVRHVILRFMRKVCLFNSRKQPSSANIKCKCRHKR